jgi:hypothetical protein
MEDSKVDNEALIAEMLQMANEAEKVDELKDMERVIHQGDSEIPSPMTLSYLKSAGYCYVYDTQTGERSECNLNMLKKQLEKKRPDGSRVFTITKPSVKPRQGTYKCMLHADDPNRAHYDDLGFPVCRKANLTSPFQVKRHMQKRHKVEWSAIEDERHEAERQEDRKLQESLITKVASLAPAGEVKPKRKRRS